MRLSLPYWAAACVVATCCVSAASEQSNTLDDYAVQVATTMLDTTATLSSWIKANPNDTLSAVYPLYANDPVFCRASIGEASVGDHHATRFAVFSIIPPANEQLPADTLRAAEQLCRLTTILVETEEMDSATAVALNDDVTKAIAAKLGVPTPGTRLSEGTIEGWVDSKTWSKPRSRVILATIRGRTARKVILEAYSQSSAVTDNDFFTANYFEEVKREQEARRATLVDADSAILWAGLPSIAVDLRRVLVELRRPRDRFDTLRNAATDSALIRALIATRDTAPHLDSARQAAALLAADIVRFATVPYPPPPGSPAGWLYDTLQSINTGSEVHGFDRSSAFARPWLWQAYALDSLGPTGHLAFVRLLARGFDEEKECAQSADFYRTMIDRGEADIRRGDSDPIVHFYVGAAYSAIFALAQTDSGDYVDSVPPKSEGEVARVRALDHFRIALASLSSESRRREAWYLGARLLLRKPASPWWFCASEDD
ncbi:MAG TPA: hypothetical protein VJ865_16360 [Gemmatimonadaceae bacterium]|nr:hypothetical protein [Gemmatimonadaceae bacterium]